MVTFVPAVRHTNFRKDRKCYPPSIVLWGPLGSKADGRQLRPCPWDIEGHAIEGQAKMGW